MLIRFIMLMADNLPGRAQPNEGRQCRRGPEVEPGVAGRAGRLIRIHCPSRLPSITPLGRPRVPPYQQSRDHPARRLRRQGPGGQGSPDAQPQGSGGRSPRAGQGARWTRRPRRRCSASAAPSPTPRCAQGMRTGDERYLPARDKGPVQAVHPQLRRRPALDRGVPAAAAARDHGRCSTPAARTWSGSAACSGRRRSSSSPLDTLWLLFRLKRALRAEVPRREPEGHHLLHAPARAPAALAADAQAPGQDRRRPKR